jgi:hypothetical protein
MDDIGLKGANLLFEFTYCQQVIAFNGKVFDGMSQLAKGFALLQCKGKEVLGKLWLVSADDEEFHYFRRKAKG